MEDEKKPAVDNPAPATDQAPEQSSSQAPSTVAEQGAGTVEANDANPHTDSSEASGHDQPPENPDPTAVEAADSERGEGGSPASADARERGTDGPAGDEDTEQDVPEGALGDDEARAAEERQAAAARAEAEAARRSDDAPEMTMEDVMAASDEQLARKPVHRGMITNGEIIMLAQDGIIVDVGAKIEGLLPYNQLFDFDTNAEEAAKYFKPGDEIQVYVVRSDVPNNTIILSKKRADQERAWNLLQDIYDQQRPVDVEIVEKVKGGLVANLGIRAFLPASQVDVRRVNDLSPFVEQRLRVKIIELNRRRNRVIISRRAILEEQIKEQKAETLQKLEPGLRLEGEVVEITDFGAFVNLGGIDGLVHRSELTHGRFNHPRDVVKVGEKVQVEVLDMDLERERINLSMKSLVTNPWDDVLTKYQIGHRVAGKVTNLTQFGAFVEIEPGLEGLIHVSEMSWTKRVRHPKEVLTEGDEVEAMILKIDTNQQRISLGLRQTQPDPWSSLPDRYPPGTEITGPITGITDFGVFMEIEEGIEGLVHISELAHEHVESITDHFNRGDEITAVILNIDPIEQRASLSRKRLLPYTASSLDTMPTGAPAAARTSGRKGRRGGRRGAEIDYDYGYAESSNQGRNTTKLGDVYADLFAQFGLGDSGSEKRDEEATEAKAGTEPPQQAPEGEAASAAAEPQTGSDATSEAEAHAEPHDAERTPAGAAAPTSDAASAPAPGEADAAAEAPAGEAEPQTPGDAERAPATSEDERQPADASAQRQQEGGQQEGAIDAAEAAAMLTAAFREGKRPAAQQQESAQQQERAQGEQRNDQSEEPAEAERTERTEEDPEKEPQR